jgi:glycerophosphoryl diester phosphodiesterase
VPIRTHLIDGSVHPLLLGHRGAPAAVPENTLASLHRAVDLGADGVELDVRLSRDGVPVVIHDETVDRTTSGRGRVDSHTAAELGGLDAGAGEGVPTLGAVACWAAAAGVWLNVELKEARAAGPALEVLASAGVLPRSFLSSFHPSAVDALRALDPAAARWLLTERWSEAVAAEAVRLDVRGVCLGDEGATASALEDLRRRRLPCVVWTVDSPERARALFRSGCAGVITNRPGVVRRPGSG